MQLKLSLGAGFVPQLRRLAERAANTGAFTARLGQTMVREWIPWIFRNNQWRSGDSRSGRPMMDSLRLYSSIAWRSSPRRTEVYTRVPYGGHLNGHKGLSYTVTPKRAKLLAIPNPNVLGIRASRGAQPADYQRLVARNGPRGLGLYQDSVRGSTLKNREPHFFLKRSVVIRARPYLYWTAEWIGKAANAFINYVATGDRTGMGARAEGGNPDVGRRGGGRP